MKQHFYWRSAFFLIGILCLSFGVTLTVKGQIVGVGSWDVLHVGLADTIGLTIGFWSILLGLIILAIDSAVMKRLPRLGTYLDMFLTGIFVDIFNFLLPNATTLAMQIISFIVGIVFLGFGCGMYMVANLGVGPRDTLMLLIVQKFGWTFSKARTTMEISVAIIGFLFGGPLGVGTVLMAFTLGPIVQFSLTLNEKLFKRMTGSDSQLLQSQS